MAHFWYGALTGTILLLIAFYGYYRNRHRIFISEDGEYMKLLTDEELKSVLYFSTKQRDPKFRQPSSLDRRESS